MESKIDKKEKMNVYFQSLLRHAGFKATPKRVALLEVLRDAKSPMKTEDILEKLKRTPLDQATLYRALKELKEANIVRQIDFEHGHAHYELVGKNDHHHLVCVRCGKVEDFTGCGIEAIVKRIAKQSKGFGEITRHSLEFFGVCKACKKKER